MFSNSRKLAQQTAQRLIGGHFTLTAWWTLKHAGVLDAMRKLDDDGGEGILPLVYAARTSMSPEVLDALLDYLASDGAGALVAIKGGQAHLTPEAKALLEHEDGVLELVHAYQPVLDVAEHMLARLKTGAGAPILRKSDTLNESQARRYAEEVFPAVLAMLVKHKLTQVLDLSCGTGDLLMHIAAHSKNIVGVGIGADGQAVRRANKTIAGQGLEKRLIAVAANPFDVCTDTQRTFDRIGISRQLWDELDCLVAPQFLSELAARDAAGAPGAAPESTGGAVNRALASIRRNFPKAHLLVIEPTASPRLARNYYAAELSLLLRLSKTALRPADKWQQLFRESKLTVVQETPLTTDGLTLFLCKPR